MLVFADVVVVFGWGLFKNCVCVFGFEMIYGVYVRIPNYRG